MSSNSLNVIKWRKRTKLKLIDYKGGKCQRCGYSKNYPSVYDFHHRDPEKKEFCISGHRLTLSFEKLKKEADKCDLFCKNCHAEVHEEEYKKTGVFLRKKTNKNCPVCKKSLLVTNKFCSKSCYAISRRKVPRPKRKQLIKDLKIMSWSATGRKYGVSDNAIRKWYKSFCKE